MLRFVTLLLMSLAIVGSSTQIFASENEDAGSSKDPDRAASPRAQKFLANYIISDEAVECIVDRRAKPREEVRRLIDLDPFRLVVELKSRDLYLNMLEGAVGCSGLGRKPDITIGRGMAGQYAPHRQHRYCRGDPVEVSRRAPQSGTFFGGDITIGGCELGYFYRLVKK